MATRFSGSRLVLSHDWIVEPVKNTTTVLNECILFRGKKGFRLCLKDTTKTKNPILIFLAVNLNKLGLRVQEVRYSKQGLESSLMKEMQVANETAESICETLQLFTVNLIEIPFRKCTFSFSICMAGSVSAYSYHLSDRLTKDQFWHASMKSQHHVDVEFVVKDKNFSAHKAVLAARSPVFAADFTKEKPEQKDDDGDGLQQIIRIDDVDPASVEQFLYFLYTGEPMKSSLTNEELLNLAERYQVITLVNLCRAASKNIDVQQMISCMYNINQGALEMHKEAQLLNSTNKWLNKEKEIFHEDTTSVFHYCWETAFSAALTPSAIIEYQNEKLFAPHVSGNILVKPNRDRAIEHPWIHLIFANHQNFGHKAAKAFCSMDYGTWMEMKPKRVDAVELILFAAQGSGSLITHFYNPLKLYFRIEMTSNIENYRYEMMDTSWTTQLWQAALNQQLTDVEIFVGPIKLEAHRVILSARSPVLAALLKNNDQLKSSIVIEENMDIDVVKHFLKFLYTGCLEISATNKQLLELAKMYKVETLMKICQLANNISPDDTSKLDASKVDAPDKPSVTFQMNLEVVKHFLTFLSTGSMNSSIINIRQITELAEMYGVGTINKIFQLNRSVPLDMDEIATFLLTAI